MIRNEMRKIYETENGKRKMFETTFENNKRLVIEITKIEHDKRDKKGLMNLWLKNGLVDKFMNETLHIDTYFYDENGNCFGRYNPQIADDNRTINFNYMLESTKENEEFLISEILRLANEDLKQSKANETLEDIQDFIDSFESDITHDTKEIINKDDFER